MNITEDKVKEFDKASLMLCLETLADVVDCINAALGQDPPEAELLPVGPEAYMQGYNDGLLIVLKKVARMMLVISNCLKEKAMNKEEE